MYLGARHFDHKGRSSFNDMRVFRPGVPELSGLAECFREIAGEPVEGAGLASGDSLDPGRGGGKGPGDDDVMEVYDALRERLRHPNSPSAARNWPSVIFT